MPSLFSFLPAREPGRAAVDHEGRHVAAPLRLRVGDRHHDVDVADRAVGAEGLGAVEQPAAVDLARRGARGRGVGAGARLGQAPGADLLAARERRHPAAPLLGRCRTCRCGWCTASCAPPPRCRPRGRPWTARSPPARTRRSRAPRRRTPRGRSRPGSRARPPWPSPRAGSAGLSSCSSTIGSISRRAKSRAAAWIAFCSGVRSKFTVAGSSGSPMLSRASRAPRTRRPAGPAWAYNGGMSGRRIENEEELAAIVRALRHRRRGRHEGRRAGRPAGVRDPPHVAARRASGSSRSIPSSRARSASSPIPTSRACPSASRWSTSSGESTPSRSSPTRSWRCPPSGARRWSGCRPASVTTTPPTACSPPASTSSRTAVWASTPAATTAGSRRRRQPRQRHARVVVGEDGAVVVTAARHAVGADLAEADAVSPAAAAELPAGGTARGRQPARGEQRVGQLERPAHGEAGDLERLAVRARSAGSTPTRPETPRVSTSKPVEGEAREARADARAIARRRCGSGSSSTACARGRSWRRAGRRCCTTASGALAREIDAQPSPAASARSPARSRSASARKASRSGAIGKRSSLAAVARQQRPVAQRREGQLALDDEPPGAAPAGTAAPRPPRRRALRRPAAGRSSSLLASHAAKRSSSCAPVRAAARRPGRRAPPGGRRAGRRARGRRRRRGSGRPRAARARPAGRPPARSRPRCASAAARVRGRPADRIGAGASGSARRVTAAGKRSPGAGRRVQPLEAGLDAGHAAQVGAALEREDRAHVLGVAAAGGAVERVDRLAVVEQHLAGGLGDGAVGERMLVVHAAVDLAARRAAQVVALVGELAQVAQRVGARRDRLRLRGLELRVGAGAELARHDAAQVVLERQLVDQVETAAVVEEDHDLAPIAAPLDAQAAARRRLEREAPPLDPVDAARAAPPRAPGRTAPRPRRPPRRRRRRGG